MRILDVAEQIKRQTIAHGDYQRIAENTGISYSWVQKFAIGKAPNPTVKNLHRLESYFFTIQQRDKAA